MKTTIKTIGISVSACLLASAAIAQEPLNTSDLLRAVEEDRVAQSQEYQQRLSEFDQSANRQEELLELTQSRVVEQENLQTQLSDQFEANEITIAEKREILRDRRGDLNELFGTLQGVAGDFMSTFTGSIISAQYPGRTDYLEGFIARAGSTTEQLAIDEIERFWYFMQQEMTESGKVARYSGTVALSSGEAVSRQITRIGSFNAVAEGEYLA